MCRSIKFTSLRDVSENFRIPKLGQLIHIQIEGDWRDEACGLMLGYDHDALKDDIFIKLQNGLLYYRKPLYCSISIECLGLDCKVEYTNANQAIIPEAHNIQVQYIDSDLDNTFQGRIPSFPVLYFCWTPLNQILQFQRRLPAGNMILTFSKGARELNNGYYVLKVNNIWWGFQQSTKIRMVGLIVLTGSSRLSNRLI